MRFVCSSLTLLHSIDKMTQHAVRLFTLPELLGFLAMKINAKFAAADRYCHSVLLYYQHKFTSW